MSIAHWFARLLRGRQVQGEQGLDGRTGEDLVKQAAVDPDPTPQDELDMDLPPCPLGLAQVDQWFYPWLLDLRAFVDQPLTPTEIELLEVFKQIASGQRSSTQLVPRMPTVVPELLRSLKDERLSGLQLARRIAKDPVLVGEVIRVANSPYYRRVHQIASLEQAVVLLGRDGLYQLIARVAFYPIFNLRGGKLIHLAAARLWPQSERCAIACHCLARRLDQDTFAAYLGGLTVNLGLIVGLRLMEQRLDNERDPVPVAAAFYHELIPLARQLSQRIIASWNFPEGAIQSIAGYTKGEATPSALARCLALADCYSKLNLLVERGRLSADDLDQSELLTDPCYRRLMLESAPEPLARD